MNVDDFFNTDDFGVEVTIHHQDGSSLRAIVFFDERSIDSELGQVEWQTHLPTITGSTTSLEALKPNNIVDIEELQYKVAEYPEHDGTGLTVVRLHPRDETHALY